jgi:alpha-glucosidase
MSTSRKAPLAAIVSTFLFSLLGALPLEAQKGRDGHPWWQHAVFYEIYPRSFADSNNDGIGDLQGIISKLDYLQDLGVDAIWLTPCYPSPQVDFGYDVSDYRAIDPAYGTLEDFDRLVREARRRGIRIVMDFVMNHTSDRHEWFVDSRASRTARHRDWYIWREGRGAGQPPNNWQSTFGGSAWKFDATTGQYYYHFFYPEQPDLNWRNPEVKKAMFSIVRYWYDRGAAGFRLDAVTTLFEDPELRDNPVHPGVNWVGDPNQEFKYNDRLPEVHDALRELRRVTDEYKDRVLLGETSAENLAGLSQFCKGNQELHLAMNFFFTGVNKLSPAEFRKQTELWDKAGCWPVYLFSNHDQTRHYVRYGDGKSNDAIAKVTAALLLTLRGTPILYYGEEVGMENNDPKSKEDVKDPIGKLFWPNNKGRDGERTPMQWDGGANAGFSTAAPWLPVPPSYKTHNVAAESREPDSVLNWYKRLIALRRKSPALLDGDHIPLNENGEYVLGYLRKLGSQAVLVLLNMSPSSQEVDLDLKPQGFASKRVKTLLTTAPTRARTVEAGRLRLEPFEAYIGEVRR